MIFTSVNFVDHTSLHGCRQWLPLNGEMPKWQMLTSPGVWRRNLNEYSSLSFINYYFTRCWGKPKYVDSSEFLLKHFYFTSPSFIAGVELNNFSQSTFLPKYQTQPTQLNTLASVKINNFSQSTFLHRYQIQMIDLPTKLNTQASVELNSLSPSTFLPWYNVRVTNSLVRVC